MAHPFGGSSSHSHPYVVTTSDGSTFSILVKGRELWALQRLMAAGPAGCTPIDQPAPRWSHYVWKLRGMGVEIETIHERHEGPFAGNHARYVLKSRVEPLPSDEEKAA